MTPTPLIVHQEEPRNAEPPLERLTDAYLTPNDLFFVRSHAPVPSVDPATFELRVAGRVEEELRLSLADLKDDFEAVTVTATLQCAGNRRDELMEVRDLPGEVPWRAAAIGTARWRGARLRDVLDRAGILADGEHVEFLGLDRIDRDGDVIGFGGSIPLSRALEGDVLLAWEMNGEPLPPDHGFPLRAVVPGYIGARSVKWLGEVTVRSEPSENHYQARSYKLFPPHVTPDTADWEEGLMLGELPVQAVITQPREGATVDAGPTRVRGYAMAGGDRTVERLDVSPDGGRSWTVAEWTAGEGEPGTWRLWEAELDLTPGEHELVARAWDSSAHTQPARAEPIWNFKGYISNAWHRVAVRARRS